MQVPAVNKLIFLKGAEGAFRSIFLPDLNVRWQALCENIYEAVRHLSSLSGEEFVVFFAPVRALLIENGSFLTFLKHHPHIRCVALHSDNQTFPPALQQAVWEGTILPCPSSVSAQDALRWAIEGQRNRPAQKPASQSNFDEFRISPQEREALFHPE